MKTRIAVAVGLIAVMTGLATWSAAESAPKKTSESAIPAGYRFITAALPGEQVAFLKAGQRVDVLVTFDAILQDKSKEKVTSTILQNVIVRSVLRPAKIEDKGAVELIVNQNEAQYMALGLHRGDLHLSVRGEGDKAMEPMEMASFRKLFQ